MLAPSGLRLSSLRFWDTVRAILKHLSEEDLPSDLLVPVALRRIAGAPKDFERK